MEVYKLPEVGLHCKKKNKKKRRIILCNIYRNDIYYTFNRYISSFVKFIKKKNDVQLDQF